MFQLITDFVNYNDIITENIITYYYQGICPQTGKILRLPRTLFIEKIAQQLVKLLEKETIYNLEGKMYGVLLVENNEGQLGVIKAFSGLLNGQSIVEGWVGEISGKKTLFLAENLTLHQLEQIKQEIITLENLAVKQKYQKLLTESELLREKINLRHRKSKQLRQETRQVLGEAITPEIRDKLEQESRLEGIEKRNFKRQWQEILLPLKIKIEQADQKNLELKRQRKNLSRNLQLQMQATYSLTNFAGVTLNLAEVINKSFIPTGTGDCCAPKLLHYAAMNNLKPLAMAEFWWGESSLSANKIKGHFYPACEERCQPLMGFLLSGIKANIPIFKDYHIPVIYEDQYLLIIDKPSGLLSVSGRGSQHYDSVATRLKFKPVHRLDQDTSGLLVLAKTEESYIKMKGLFAQKQVKKVYYAVLEAEIRQKSGLIDLPLWGNPENRPFQMVNWEKGKPSQTYFRLIASENEHSRVEFIPLTGRNHQIRVHSREGLGVAILGDRFYGSKGQYTRLHLHAAQIKFQHPILKNSLNLNIETPF